MESTILSDYDQEIRGRILNAARDQFFTFGFSRVTVDEIANKLGMSKKTLYKFFPSKEELVHEVARMQMKETDHCCKSFLMEDGLDFVGKLKAMMTFVGLQYAKLGRPLIEDLEKYAPHVWKEVCDSRSAMIQQDFGRLLREGVEQGIFRDDIDKDLVLLIYTNAMRNIINPEILSQIPFSAAQVFEAIVKVIFEGILTDDARKKYRTQPVVLPGNFSEKVSEII